MFFVVERSQQLRSSSLEELFAPLFFNLYANLREMGSRLTVKWPTDDLCRVQDLLGPKYDLPMMLIWCILFQEKNWDVKIWMGRDSNMENKGSASIHLEWHLRASHMPSHPSDVLPLPLNRKSGIGNEKAQSLCILNRFDGRHPGLITCPWEGDLAG